MPWKVSSVIEERLRFVALAEPKVHSITRLCEEFGISRQTGHVWLKRYRAGGVRELGNRSRRPLHSPKRTLLETEQAVVGLRKKWPDWGAPKLHALLVQEHPEWNSISVRTVHRILERYELIGERQRQRPAVKRFERKAPNELWQMDFKGPQGLAGGSPVGPLSVQDDHSRYVLALRQLGSTRMEGVRATLEQVFEEAGLPEVMLMDHGTPWWNPASPWGLSELQVWILRQGIRVTFSGIRHPQTQGKVERMHGAIQKAVRGRKGDPEDQAWLDAFRYEYNHVRPHEALGMATPASRWRRSERRFQASPPEWEYPARMQVRRLAAEGQLGWQGRRWEISNALRGQLVGIEQIGSRAIVYFCRTAVRELDLRTGTAYPIPLDAGFLQQ